MRVYLKKSFFSDRESVLVENGNMRVIAFKYSTGVEALRVENSKGYFIILPFKGQQIWRASFCGKELWMKTMMDEPQETDVYLETYGAFLLHCGLDAVGSPACYEDKHSQHGTIPNVEYRYAYVECGEGYIAVGGRYDYDKTFIKNYSFSPECKLYENDSVLKIHVEIENRRRDPLEYAYLCHINFRPVDGAELIYSADYDAEHVKVITNDNDPCELKAFKKKIAENVELHHKVGAQGEIYDPEICFTVTYKSDENGRAYTLQATDEGASYVSHPADVLPVGVRWISRTGNEDSMGMILPSTSEAMGYTYSKRTGQMKLLGAYEKLAFDIEAGYLEADAAREIRERILRIKKK